MFTTMFESATYLRLFLGGNACAIMYLKLPVASSVGCDHLILYCCAVLTCF